MSRPSRTVTDLLMDFESFLRQKGMPKNYVPAYTVIAMDIIRTNDLNKLAGMTPDEVTGHVATNAPSDISETTLSNRQKVARALVRYLAERGHRFL